MRKVFSKGQIQMMETISVLLIFFILVGVGLIFFSKVMQSSTTQKIEKFEELSRIEVAQLASNLPELQCSQDNIIKTNCIDLLKVQYLDTIASDVNSNYFDIFTYSKISVEKTFPGELEEFSIYTNIPPEYDSKLINYFPISLFDPKTQNYAFGILTVEVYR